MQALGNVAFADYETVCKQNTEPLAAPTSAVIVAGVSHAPEDSVVAESIEQLVEFDSH